MENSKVVIIDGKYNNLDGFVSCYLIVSGGHGIIIEPSTHTAVPQILEAVKKENISFDNIDYIIVTHCHLDHSGAAGSLANDYFKKAKVLAHPKAAYFMKNPSRLIAGVKGVYGEEEYNKLYGEVQGIPEDRTISVKDKEVMTLLNREFVFYHTLGHATHHMVIFDTFTKGVFTGDSFGVGQYGDVTKCLYPSTTPIDFDPVEAIKSVKLIMSLNPSCIYLTHHGVWEDVKKGGNDLISQLEKYHELAKKVPEKMKELENDEMKVRGWIEDELYKLISLATGLSDERVRVYHPTKNDAFLNAFGLYVYVQRRMKKNLEI